MIVQALLQGMVMGLSIAAPVGPIAVVVIRRTLMDGRLAELVCGLGCSMALALYGGVVGFRLAAVAGAVLTYETPLLVSGGLFLGYLGFRIARTPGALPATAPGASWGGLSRAFAATIAADGAAHPAGPSGGVAPLVLGVFAGSALWWALLSGGGGLLRARLEARWLGWAYRVSGLVIAALGARVLLHLI